ncbi:H/ACA ribonucleoprotein complex non-core subunit NAF1 [Ochlerotatus camptorhynchus]|uniref:H/ACA ribonucleoprotein complex non-core subunit NAF1 n=1 Tax=Ochlerotatus camptorhynchus TaxID=644619 RepID=UPI0031DAD272
MEPQESKTIDAEDTRGENSETVKLPVSLTEVSIAEKVADDSTSKQMEQVNAAPVEINDKEMKIPTQEGSSEQSATSKENMESTEIEMTTESAAAVQSIVFKEEPTDAEMESAEDFTRRASDFPTVPRISVKQEIPTSFQEQVAAEQAMESKAVLQINNSALALLSQYISSESESNITDSDEELPRKNTQAVRCVSTSSESSDDVQVIRNTSSYRMQDVPVIVSDTETTATGMDDSENEISEDEDGPQVNPPIKSKGEVLLNELPPIEDLQISVSEAECKPIGHVQSIVAQIVIVQSYAGVELLNLETVLFLEKGKRALGKIFDVIGQVVAPMYCVLFNNRQDVVRRGISVGMPVYCAPQTEHTSFIILSDLMRHKGSDASWLDDNEAPDHVLDYSDDEQERRARRRRGSCSSSGRNSPDGGHPSYQPYQVHQPHHQRRGRGGGYRGRQGHSWHDNFPVQHQPQRVINPFAFVAGVPPPPPPPPPPPGSNNN